MQKEHASDFTAARWKSADEIASFIASLDGVTSSDIVEMLDVLTSRKAVPGSAEQRNRVKIFTEVASSHGDRSLFEHYLKALKSEDRYLKNALVELLPKVNNPSHHHKLAELLKSQDGSLRRAVVQVFQKIGDRNIVRSLSEMLAERNFAGRNEVIDLAGALPGPYSFDVFRAVFENGSPHEMVRVLKYLGSQAFVKNNAKSIAALVRPLFTQPAETVAAELIAVFSKVAGEEEYFQLAGEYLYHANPELVKTAVTGLSSFCSPRVMAALERKIYTGPLSIRLAVLETIHNIGRREVCKPLVKALEHRQQQVRERAGEVLARLTKAEKIEVADAVIWLMRSSDAKVRHKAIEIVRSAGDRGGHLWSEVLAKLRQEDWWARQRIAHSLVVLAGNELTSHVLKYLSDPSDIIRRLGLEMLVKIKAPEVFDSLLKAAKEDGDWWVREKAVEAVAALNDPRAVPQLLNIAAAHIELEVPVLTSLKGVITGAHVHSFLASENPDVRFAALQCLNVRPHPESAEKILPLTRDPDLRVSRLAREIAGKWKLEYSASVMRNDASLSALDRMLIAIKDAEGDDLVLLPGQTPYMKKHGRMFALAKVPITAAQIQSIVKPLVSPQQIRELQGMRDVDFSYEVKSEGLRFRVNLFLSRTGVSMVFRIIRGDVWRLDDLGLPAVVKTFSEFKNGLVLVGGPTGSGKSTTLAAIIDDINGSSRRHVISIEDPIEVVHKTKEGLVNQREVGVHTPSFTEALRMTLREDPDVILVGEMRDLPTIQFAVTAAETGHLVFGTVHTVSADSSVDRLINAYPPEGQEQVRSMLADSLRAVLCQYLIRHKEKDEKVLACEVMLNNHAIGNLIRKGKTFQIPSVMTTSREQQMQLMDDSLMALYKQGIITAEDAYVKARNKTDFEEMVGIKREKKGNAANGAEKGRRQE